MLLYSLSSNLRSVNIIPSKEIHPYITITALHLTMFSSIISIPPASDLVAWLDDQVMTIIMNIMNVKDDQYLKRRDGVRRGSTTQPTPFLGNLFLLVPCSTPNLNMGRTQGNFGYWPICLRHSHRNGITLTVTNCCSPIA